ncbi:DNA-3-methyladenine glycosylase [Candidatus Bealeia paramacronuclearis]|uniref:DNA-3-methyladenine glycosylase n=1 Tax=Candidatus Bealeia paramacronuclearis TaxID=1921001 RepID=UPI0039C4641B
MNLPRLNRAYFENPTLEVAQDLIGKVMIFGEHQGIITETEAYIGQDDPACHAVRGITPRNAVMFGPPGVSYVYFIYGMYHCLNFVTEKEGFPAAVLIRGLKMKDSNMHYDGPGKLCRTLNLTREHNGLDLTLHPTFGVYEGGLTIPFRATPRIGIKQGTDKLWRFIAERF